MYWLYLLSMAKKENSIANLERCDEGSETIDYFSQRHASSREYDFQNHKVYVVLMYDRSSAVSSGNRVRLDLGKNDCITEKCDEKS